MKLTLDNVSYNQILHHLSCTISTGITYVVGKNGSGKSTLLKLCATAIEPSDGKITYSRMVSNTSGIMSEEDVRKTISYVPQEFTGYAELSIEKYIQYMATHKGIPHSYVKKISQRWLENTNLYAIRKKKLRALSGGQLKKVGVIQALINQPRICILDEPFEHLDIAERIFFENEIQKLAVNSLILISTHLVHQPNDAHILLLEKGQIQQYEQCTEVVYKRIVEQLER